MEKVKPDIKCVDYWPKKIPPEKLAAYKTLVDEGQIKVLHVIHDKTSGSTLVEYLANCPHEWIRNELKKRSDFNV